MNGNHPSKFEDNIVGKTLSVEESRTAVERADKWLKSGKIADPEPTEFPVTDINGRKYSPEEVHEFVEQFSDR